MALSLSPQSEIPRVRRKSTFIRTVTVTAGESETVNSISVALQGEVEPNISIVTGNNSFISLESGNGSVFAANLQ